jgi:hypothetical protein
VNQKLVSVIFERLIISLLWKMYQQLEEDVAQSSNNDNCKQYNQGPTYTLPPSYDTATDFKNNDEDDDAAKSRSADVARRRIPKTPALEVECVPASDPVLAGLGWVRKAFKRNSNPKHIDRYWVTPKKGKKLRSMAEVTNFLEYLRETRGDEDEAYRILKRVNAEKRRSNASSRKESKVDNEEEEPVETSSPTTLNTTTSSSEAITIIPV